MKEQFMDCSDRAPEGHLKWLLEESDEVIPAVEGLFYELTYCDEGKIFPTVVMRDAEGAPIAGAQMSYDDLMNFARWAMQNGLALLNIKMSGMGGLTVADTAVRNHLRDHLGDLLKFVEEQLPGPFEDLIKDSQQKVTAKAVETAVERAIRDAKAEVMAEAALERKALEQRHAQNIVQLSKVATLPVESRDEALGDPILQDVILKAVNTLADSRSTS